MFNKSATMLRLQTGDGFGDFGGRERTKTPGSSASKD